MLNASIILLAAILLSGLLYFEKNENRKGLLPTKTVLSLLFILAALAQSHPNPGYYRLLLVGLILCLGGDVCLALPQQKAFLPGLVSFLLGHVCYVFAFFTVSVSGLAILAGSVLGVVMSGWIYRWLLPYLGTMKVPVLLYVIVITVMVTGASSVLGAEELSVKGRIVVLVGAVLFYFSDVFVARDRFVKKEFFNRLVGLPMYYAGQFLLAFSVGLLTSS